MLTIRRPLRAGFTLAEVIVALLLFSIGALGASAAASAAARLGASGRVLVGATRDLGRVTDSLRARPCLALVPGRAAVPGGTVDWTVTAGLTAVTLAVRLTPVRSRLARTLVTNTIVPCE